jgi:hypothetical protein
VIVAHPDQPLSGCSRRSLVARASVYALRRIAMAITVEKKQQQLLAFVYNMIAIVIVVIANLRGSG